MARLPGLRAARPHDDSRAGGGLRGAEGRARSAPRALFDELREAGLALDTLSMGMTADLEAAIAAGSTMVRVGTAIFGGAAQGRGLSD